MGQAPERTPTTLRRPLRPSRLNADYQQLLSALQQTARGRWFLSEFAKRNRSADTELILHAVRALDAKIEAARVREPATSPDFAAAPDHVPAAAGLGDAERAEIGAALRAAVEGLESANKARTQIRFSLLESAEAIADAVWQAREHGLTDVVQDEIERGASKILQACAQKDQAAERIARVDRSLRALLHRLGAEAFPEPAASAPKRAAEPAAREPAAREPARDTKHVREPLPFSPETEERLALLAASIEAGMQALVRSQSQDGAADEGTPAGSGAEADDIWSDDGGRDDHDFAASPHDRAEPQAASALSRLHAAKRAALFG
jgi:hypothetical protein